MEDDPARAAWIEAAAAKLAPRLADPAVRAEVAGLLGADDQQPARRREAAQRALASLELRWKLREGEPWGG